MKKFHSVQTLFRAIVKMLSIILSLSCIGVWIGLGAMSSKKGELKSDPDIFVVMHGSKSGWMRRISYASVTNNLSQIRLKLKDYQPFSSIDGGTYYLAFSTNHIWKVEVDTYDQFETLVKRLDDQEPTYTTNALLNLDYIEKRSGWLSGFELSEIQRRLPKKEDVQNTSGSPQNY
jgi:hypothetical protein